MNDTILFVDDDIRVVSALQRSLYRSYRIEIAANAADALEAIGETRYAVVVSDLNMPGMSGIEFLAKVKAQSPDTIRILLTGQADLQVAISAVNEGNVFRFLTKPCPSDLLTRALDAALDQHRLLLAEHDILQETLVGAVAVVTEMLGSVDSEMPGRTRWVRRAVLELADALSLHDTWELETAAMFSLVGSLSEDGGNKGQRGRTLKRLLQNVPRLRKVSEIVEAQLAAPVDESNEGSATLATEILRAALALETLTRADSSVESAIAVMQTDNGRYLPAVLSAATGRSAALAGLAGERAASAKGELDQEILLPFANRVLRTLKGAAVADSAVAVPEIAAVESFPITR